VATYAGLSVFITYSYSKCLETFSKEHGK